MPNEETRPYLVNVSRKIVHSVTSELPFCQPDEGDNVGYADEGRLPDLMQQKFMPCPYCLKDEADDLLGT